MDELLVNNKKLTIDKRKDQLLVNGEVSEYKIERLSSHSFKVYSPTEIYKVEVIARTGNQFTLSVNNQAVEVEAIDRMSQILTELGMDTVQSTTVSELKAPMPGSILSIIAKEGMEVQNGDQLLILEAMKMENVIKSPGEGIIDRIHVSLNESVEKNQVLISFK